MVATTSTCDPLWAFVLGDYDDYYDEATAKPKDESREPEQQVKEEKEEAKETVTSQAAKPKAAKNKLEQKSDQSSDDEEVMQYFLGTGDAQKHTKRSKKIFKKRLKKLASTQVRLKEVDGKETLQAVGGEWRLFGDMPIPLKENVETFKARRKASLLEERTQEPPQEIIATKKEEPIESVAFMKWWKLKSRETSVTNDGSNTRNGKPGVHSSTIEDSIILGGADMESLVGGAELLDCDASVIDLTEFALKRVHGSMDADDIQCVEEEELQVKCPKDLNEKFGLEKQEKRADLQGSVTEERIKAEGPTLQGSCQGIYQSVDEYRLVSLSLPKKPTSTLQNSGQGIDQSGDEYRLVSLSLPQNPSSTLEGSGQGIDLSGDKHSIRIASLSLPKNPSSDLNRAADEFIATKLIKDDAVVRAKPPKTPQPNLRHRFPGGLAARRNVHKFSKKRSEMEMETASGRDRASDSEGASKLADESSDARHGKGQLRHSTAYLSSNKRSGSLAKTHPLNSSYTRADKNERTAVRSESDGRPRSNRAKYLRKVEDPRYRNARPDSAYTRDTPSDPYARSRESNGYRNSRLAEFEYYDVTMIDDEYSYEDALENRLTLPVSVQREIEANISKRSSASKVDKLRTDGLGRLRNPSTVDLKRHERLQYLKKSLSKSNEKEIQQRLYYPDLLEAGPSFGMIPAGSLSLR